MHERLQTSAQPPRRDDWEPVARWENEGGAADERELAADPGRRAASPQDGDATARE